MMCHVIKPILFLAIIFYSGAEPPDFRILAPEFVCPKDEEAAQVKPDNTIITISTKGGFALSIGWMVRWTPLPAPTQRFTLMLWRATRALEKKLNGPQIEPFVYVIENDELLRGVNYIFNVTATNSNFETTSKSFQINNVLGDQKLEDIEGQSYMLSIMLVGGQDTYADVEYALEAEVTTCHPTQDYYFEWTVQSAETGDRVDISSMSSRLEIPAHSLKAGLTYYVTCQVTRYSNGDFVTQSGLPLTVLQRTFEVYLNVDRLMVTVNTPFSILSILFNHDYFGNYFTYEWQCTIEGEPCNFFTSTDNDTLYFEDGLSKIGRYEVALTVSAHDRSATSSAVITTVPHLLPVIQISPLPRILNEGSTVSLVANASNVTPSCSLAWYFASEEYLSSQTQVANDTCDDCQHGEQLSETLTVFSLEENFLDELTDFTNETEWRQVTAQMPAATGRVRFLAQCGCSLVFDCDAQGSVFADVSFQLNKIPKANNVMVAPNSGSALSTIFRLSTLAVVDLNTPLYYTFYCRIGVNSTLVLGSHAEHLAVETFLPYFEDGTEIWVEVCDVLGACSTSASKTVKLSAGDGATVAMLLEDAHAHVRRCELMQLQRVAVAAIVTYRNADQTDSMEEFCTNLLNTLSMAQDDCLKNKPTLYLAFLSQLTDVGCDTTSLM